MSLNSHFYVEIDCNRMHKKNLGWHRVEKSDVYRTRGRSYKIYEIFKIIENYFIVPKNKSNRLNRIF